MTFSFIPREKALYFNFWKVVLLRQYRIMKSEGEIRLWWDMGQHSLCFKCILISKTWVWMEARLKKRGRGRGCEERADRPDRKSTREESHKTMFSAGQPKVFCRKGFPDGHLLSRWRAANSYSSYRNSPVNVCLDSSPRPLLRPRCALWTHDGTEISLALWIETSHFPVLILPLLSLCAVVPWTTQTILDCVRVCQ